MYVLWDISDDTLRRKVNTSDASEFARICGGCGSRRTSFVTPFPFPKLMIDDPLVWGAVWLIVAIVFFALGILVGLVAFKVCEAAKCLLSPGLIYPPAKFRAAKSRRSKVPSSSWHVRRLCKFAQRTSSRLLFTFFGHGRTLVNAHTNESAHDMMPLPLAITYGHRYTLFINTLLPFL